ncbi:MAG: hypothetical protein WA761_05960 [Thermoplasmata archaeon]
MGALIVLLLLLTFLAMLYPATGPGFPILAIWAASVCLLAAQSLLFSLVPRRSPIVGRLGISPQGLYLALPPRGFSVPWSALKRMGPDWIEVPRPSGIGSQRFRLTAYQADRLSAFVRDPVLDQPLRGWSLTRPSS